MMNCTSLTPVTISMQPTYWGGAAYAAQQLGYFQDLCLDVTISVYPSGAPQVNDVDSWAVGGMGGTPSIQGYTQGVLQTIGINNDGTATNALVANADGLAAWDEIVAAGTLGDTIMSISPNSTGEFVVEECLNMYNVSFDPAVNFEYDTTQGGIGSSLSDPNGNDFGSLWAPALYNLLETVDGSGVVCNGTTAGVKVVGTITVSNEAAEVEPEAAALALAGYIKGITYFKAPQHRDQAKAYLNDFYVEQGLPALSDAALDVEFSRTLYNLEEQLEVTAKNANNVSILGGWLEQQATFMLEGGILSEAINPDDYITDFYLQWIASNETLVTWVNDVTGPMDAPSPTEAPSSGKVSGLAVPILISVAALVYMTI